MTITELCEGLKLPKVVKDKIEVFEAEMDYSIFHEDMQKLQERMYWESAVEHLKQLCGEDPDGLKILTVCMHCMLDTYAGYKEKGIADQIFWDTMGFVPRFLQSHYKTHGKYAFTWAWWIPRQLSMQEFRVGDYEYEFIEEEGEDAISIHIPSDTDLAHADITAIYPFVEQFYPKYKNAKIYCDSWLLAPALQELLPETSNIRVFQEEFTLVKVDEECPYFMDWIFERSDLPLERLPEETSLQRKAKERLLSGGKIGTAVGVYKGDIRWNTQNLVNQN